jgi:hypothetical protein
MGASHFGGAGPLHGLRLSCIMWAMIFVYQKGMPVGVVSGQWPVVGGERGWGKTVRSNPVKPGQTQSNRVKPVKPVKPGQTNQPGQTSQTGLNTHSVKVHLYDGD